MAYIKKEPIIEFIKKGLNNPNKLEAFGHDAIEILAEIEYAPTADVVEVVRCKDCEYRMAIDERQYKYKGIAAMHCFIHARLCHENDFCSYGRSKENGKSDDLF